MQEPSSRNSDYCSKCDVELIDNLENFLVCPSCGVATPSISSARCFLEDEGLKKTIIVPLSIQVLLLDVIANNCLVYSLHNEALLILDQIWPIFLKKHISKESIISYSLYKAFIAQETPISLTKAASFTNSSILDLQKIISIVNTSGISDLFYPEHHIPTICSQLKIPPNQADLIKLKFHECLKKNCKSSPNAIIASIIYFAFCDENPPLTMRVFKNLKSLSLFRIAACCDLSPNTVLKCCRKLKLLFP